MNRILRFLIIFLFVLFCIENQSFAKSKKQSKSRKKDSISAEAVILVDVSKNKILYSLRIHKKYAPASTVKILTALVALEELGENTNVKISKKASQVEPSKLWLTEGQIYNSLDLINAVLISSANDASVALAEAVAQTEEGFAKKMDKRAKQLGAKNSRFMNASGLPAKNQYSTAYDLYRITKAALKNPDICNIMKKKKEKIKCVNGNGKEYTLINHNKLVFKNSNPTILLKTGYTKSAKHCYAGKIYMNGKEYVFAFLKSRNPWDDIDYLVSLIKRKKS